MHSFVRAHRRSGHFLRLAFAFFVGGIAPTSLHSTEVPLSSFAREPYGFHRAGHHVVFAAENAAGDPSLWSTSGTTEGTAEIFDPCPDPCDGIATIYFLGSSEALTYFTTIDLAAGPGRRNLYRTDGTPAGTFPLLSQSLASGLHPGASRESFALSGSRLFFRLQQGPNQVLWSTTGAPETTQAVFNPPPAPQSSEATICAHDDRAIFLRWSVQGEGAWFIRVGAHPLSVAPPIPFGDLDFECDATRPLGDSLLIPANDPLGEDGLWLANSSDGSLTRIAGSATTPRVIESDQEAALFLTWSGDDVVPSLWITDGTASGTRLLKTGTRFESIPYLTRPDQIALAGEHVFYHYRTDAGPVELRRISRLGDGDQAVAPICAAGCGGSEIPYFVERLGDDVVVSTDAAAPAQGLLRFVAGGAQPEAVLIPCSTPCTSDHSAVHVDGSLLFRVQEDPAGSDLWHLPMDANSAIRFTDFQLGTAPTPDFLEFEDFAVHRGRMLFASRESGYEDPLPFAVPLLSPCEDLTGHHTCIGSQRFRVGVRWRDFVGGSGSGQARPFTESSGYFYFFDDANIELMLKLIDGTAVNGHFWVYYGALSNVEYWITIEDSVTGAVREYHNPLGAFGSFGDIEALPSSSGASGGVFQVARQVPAPAPLEPFGSPTCFPSSTRVCLLDGRFAVEGTWEDFEGHTGIAYAEGLTLDTGYLWFFDADVAEILVKLVDGGGFNDHFWVFYGSLSNVEFTLSITDTVTGETRPYFNPLGSFGSFGDIEAFPAD